MSRVSTHVFYFTCTHIVPRGEVVEALGVADVVDQQDGVGRKDVFAQHRTLERRTTDIPDLEKHVFTK